MAVPKANVGGTMHLKGPNVPRVVGISVSEGVMKKYVRLVLSLLPLRSHTSIRTGARLAVGGPLI